MYKYKTLEDFSELDVDPKVHPSYTSIPEMSEETRKTFEAISDPKNAHLFTVESALKAFSHVKVNTDE